MHPTLRARVSSGWLPAALVVLAAGLIVAASGVPIWQIAVFGGYVLLGIAVPGMLWVRLLRGRAAHVSEDVALGLALGYCLEIASYLAARAAAAPLLFLLWPTLTLAAFAAIPALRRHWSSDGTRVPMGWSWSLAAVLGYLLVFSAGTFFTQHHLSGTDTPYVDMPYHLALIGELRHHAPPAIPYVIDVPLAYHWFFHAEAAATSWATGIDAIVLLYRLSVLPMFAAFVVLTAMAARRLSGGWWTGPLAVAVALFATVASPYAWVDGPVFDTQTLSGTWISPTNVFALLLVAAIVLSFLDVLDADGPVPRGRWLILAVLIFGAAGAKASLLPVVVVGLAVVIAAQLVTRRSLHRRAIAGLGLAGIGLVVATITLFRGTTGGLVVGPDALRSLPVVALPGAAEATGLARWVMPAAGLVIALALWSFLWAGAYGLLAWRRTSRARAGILFVAGLCLAGLGAVTVFSYPGLSQVYFLKGAAGPFGVLTSAGIAAVWPAGRSARQLVPLAVIAGLAGAAAATSLAALGPSAVPTLAAERLSGVVPRIVLPTGALLAVAGAAWVVLRRAERRRVALRGAVPVLIMALVMGYSLPGVARILALPAAGGEPGTAVPGDGIAVARWLRAHSDPGDLVATNLHCRALVGRPPVCDARHFWVSGYTERRVLVEGWAYSSTAIARAMELGLSDRTVPFWDDALLAANDAAFANPTETGLAALRARYGVRWLLADLTTADPDALGRAADVRERRGDFAVYEVRAP